MTQDQRQWVQTMKAYVTQRPSRAAKVPRNPIGRLLYDVVHSNAFEAFITTFIIFVVLAMACDYWGIENNPVHAQLYSDAMLYSSCVSQAEGPPHPMPTLNPTLIPTLIPTLNPTLGAPRTLARTVE